MFNVSNHNLDQKQMITQNAYLSSHLEWLFQSNLDNKPVNS